MKKEAFFYIIFLLLISFFINFYYAFIGVLPVDSFSTFNAGYDILNNSLPFRDFWSIKGPVLDIIQALYFKVFGISWISYAAHSSSFNSLFALSTFFVLKKFGLNNKYSFFYSSLASVLMYPTYGVPFTDHHVAIFSILSIYLTCVAIKNDNSIYWFFIPILLVLGFFTKQTPAAYFGILISLITLLYLFKNFNKNVLVYSISGLGFSLFIILFFIYIFRIPIKSFIVQYFLFPISLGETRLEWLFPLEFTRFFLRFKLLYIALLVPIVLLFNNFFKNFVSILYKENLIFLLLLGTLLIFITHQLMTINGLFIFFLIPIFSGFSHIYSNKFKNKKFLINFFVILSLVSTFYYHQKYISKRETLALKNIDLNKAIDSKKLDYRLKGLKWITYHYPENPNDEFKKLFEVIEIIKKDKKTKMIVTDYQFISVILDINDNSAARIWWRHHIYPENNNKFFFEWKSFLLNKIYKQNINVIYTIYPLEGETNIFEGLIGNDCVKTTKLTEILLKQELIKSCKELQLFKKNI